MEVVATALLTVLVGTLTFVLGQVIIRFLIEPVHAFTVVIGAISHALVKHSKEIATPYVQSDEEKRKISSELNGLAAELIERRYLIPHYLRVHRLFGLPCERQVYHAHKRLIDLSNLIYSRSENAHLANLKAKQDVCEALSIYMPSEQKVTGASNEAS